MKTKSVFTICFLSTSLLLLTSLKSVQDVLTFEGIYDGHEDYGYNFLYKDKDGEERTFTFQKINEGILKEFDLNSETLVKTKFKITYITKIEVTKDENGFDDENEINTITKLEKL